MANTFTKELKCFPMAKRKNESYYNGKKVIYPKVLLCE